jgi:hypothetical protein
MSTGRAGELHIDDEEDEKIILENGPKSTSNKS